MIRCDALVVGGGPGGSTCARLLRRHGWNVIVADRAKFPRDKVCAGWLTPDVFTQLELDPEEYRRSGLTFQEIDGVSHRDHRHASGGHAVLTHRQLRHPAMRVRRLPPSTIAVRG